MIFKSDNIAPVSRKVMEAIMNANHGTQPSYGADEYSKKLQKRFSEIFEKDVSVWLTGTGTAANSLALAALVRPFESIYCHSQAHVYTDECGAPNLFTGGSQLIIVDGENGKINPASLENKIHHSLAMSPHTQKPGCITITQATECGTVYTQKEIHEITSIARQYNIPVHMDGARFANAIISLGCTPAEITWKAGIDAMSFGATKNGALAAEAVIFFNPAYSNSFSYLHKRAGQLMSKTRFFASQFLALFEENLWLENATHANNMAQKLACLLREHRIPILLPVESNELFVKLEPQCAEYLRNEGAAFYEWDALGPGVYRFVTSFFTEPESIHKLGECLVNFYKPFSTD